MLRGARSISAFSILSLLAAGCGDNPAEPAQPGGFAQADLVTGGAMYDKWWVVAGLDEPKGDHPLWPQRPDLTSNTRSGADTYRCKECHGWDCKGVDGVYGGGSHRTGIAGILETAKSPQEIFDLLRNGHQYGPLGLKDDALWDLTRFVAEGLIDTDDIIDREGRFISTGEGGRGLYEEACASCHGADGLTNPFDAIPGQRGASPDYDEFPQVVAADNPWEFQHKVRFGQPGTDMPPLAHRNTPEEVASLGAFVRTLGE